MKNNLHPSYNSAVTVTCACGNSFATGSTLKEIKTELCSNCHPFFTGKQKLIDTTGTVDRYNQRIEAAKKARAAKSEKKPRKSRSAT